MMLAPAPDAEVLGISLIETEHAPHAHLRGVRVDYLFRDEAPTSGGRIVLGRAHKITGMAAWLSGDPGDEFETPRQYFVIELSHDIWKQLDDKQRLALVDHELCHCKADRDDNTGLMKLWTVGHDWEEFAAIIRRHGLWTTAAKKFAGSMTEQLALALDDIVANVEKLGEKPDDGKPPASPS